MNKNTRIHPTAIIYPNVVLNDNVTIGPNCIIGEPTSSYYKDPDNHDFKKTEIGKNSIIRANTIIYEGCTIGDDFQTGSNVNIRENTTIGKNCSVGTASNLNGNIKIGDYTRIHTDVFIGEETIIGNYVWIMPKVTITNDKYPPMDDIKGVKVGDYAVVCANAVLLPGVIIGENSLVSAGAVVSKDVSKEKLVRGVPAREIGSVTDIKDKDGNQMYPWRDFLKEYRGYPWQDKD